MRLVVLPIAVVAYLPARVIDTHVHNSNLSLAGVNYTYPSSFPDLVAHGDWTIGDFARESAPARAAANLSAAEFGVVLMQLEQANATRDSLLAEAAFFESVKQHCDSAGADACGVRVLGYVVGAPCDAGADAIRAYIAALRAGAGPHAVGVRETLWKASDAFFTNEAFVAGVRALGEPSIALPFELLIKPAQLRLAAGLAAAAPNTSFNLNHLGYPDISTVDSALDGDDEVRAAARTAWETWSDGIDALAALPNVACKLSGLPQTYGEPGWSARAFAPFVAKTLHAFGATRVNFAGNWFVLDEDRWNGTYTTMWAAITQTLDELRVSDADRDEVYWKSAARMYGLGT